MENRRGPDDVLGASLPRLRVDEIIEGSAPAEERTLGTTQHSRQARDFVAPGQLSQRVLRGIPLPPPLPSLRTAAPCPSVVARVGPWSLLLCVGVFLLLVMEQGVFLLAQQQLLDELDPPLFVKLLTCLNCLV